MMTDRQKQDLDRWLTTPPEEKYPENDFSDYEERMLVEEEDDNRDLSWEDMFYPEDGEPYDVPFV